MHAGSTSPSRVLIYRLGSLGDTVVALPALRLVARAFPHAERWVLTSGDTDGRAASMNAVLEGTGLVHGYIEYPIGLRSPRALVGLRRDIRSLGPDVLVYLAAARGRAKAWRDALFFRWCGIRSLVGVPYRQDQQSPRRLAGARYEYEGARLLRCLGALGAADVDAPGAFELGITAREGAAAAAALGPLGDGRPLLMASIGAKLDVKDWEDANWRDLLARLAVCLPGWGLVLVGAGDEWSRSEDLLRQWSGGRVNLCGRLTVRESAALLAHARVYVGHDSGPMHLAAAVGTPCVAIFSSRNLPGEWFPHGNRHRVLYQAIPCQGCRLESCVARNKECIRSITAAQVEASVLAVIREQGGDSG